MEFGALEGPSISAKCDADEHFNMQKTTFLKCNKLFPDNHKSLRVCSRGALYFRCRYVAKHRPLLL